MKTEKLDVYDIITERICALLESGTVPWRKEWKSAASGGLLPANFKSKKTYRGINCFLLSASAYTCPFWGSFKQVKEAGGEVRKGQKGTPVVFWNWVEKLDKETGKKTRVPFLRYYTVFNLEQCDGVTWSVPAIERPAGFSPISECEKVVEGMPKAPALDHGGTRAFYRPSTDSVTMPHKVDFSKPAAYYSTLFHELTHATGHESRLARKGIVGAVAAFGSNDYGREELVAEMGAAFLCGHAGISPETIENSAAYLASWLKAIREDRKLVVTAAAQAQRAADFILGRTFEAPEETTAATA